MWIGPGSCTSGCTRRSVDEVASLRAAVVAQVESGAIDPTLADAVRRLHALEWTEGTAVFLTINLTLHPKAVHA